MFKIVETSEKGKKELTIVPTAWEFNGELLWPKLRADKLIRIADSIPNESWFHMKCKLKRNYLINYEVAEEELLRMLETEETEQEDEQLFKYQPEARKRKTKGTTSEITVINNEHDFNTMAKSCMISENVIIEESEPSEDISDSVLEYTFMPHDVPTKKNNYEINLLENILSNQKTIMENQNSIIDHLQRNFATSDNQTAIVQQLAKMETILDLIATQKSKCVCNTVSSVSTTKIDHIVTFSFTKIESIDDLNLIEKSLEKEETMKDYVTKLSFVCGQKGNGKGLDNCYLLIDRIFSRKFFTNCSWAGGSRNQKEKIPFKIYKNIISLFFKIIHLSDQNFSLTECEDFFKNIIRNSTRRSQCKMQRTSHSKRRPKNLAYSIKSNIQNDEDKTKEIIVEEEVAKSDASD